MMSNEQVAKNWYSFLGYSDRCVRGGIDFFQDDAIYSQVFKKIPNETFWTNLGNDAYFTPSDELFDSGTPPVHLYLLVRVVAKYIDSRTISFRRNKEAAVARGVREGVLRRDPQTGRMMSSEEEVNRFLVDDSEYRLNIMLNNMKDILIELYSLVLSHRYGQLDSQLAKRILSSRDVARFVKSGCATEVAPVGDQDGTKIIGPIYEFLRYSTKQYYFDNQAEIQAAARLKAYLWQRRVVNRMRENVLRLSARIVDYNQPWKPEGKNFFESLPDQARVGRVPSGTEIT
jgi:hypothetical protein